MLKKYLVLIILIFTTASAAFAQTTTSLTLGYPGHWGHLSYTITGATLDAPTGSDPAGGRFVGGRQYKGFLTGNTLTVSGNAISDNTSGGPGSGDYYELVVTVTAGKQNKEYSYIAPKGEKLSKPFSLSVPIDPGATSGGFSIRLIEQNANYGPHGWAVSGSLTKPISVAPVGPRPTAAKPEYRISVTKFGDDFKHHPLEFEIYVTRDNKPVANAPVTFDVTGGSKALNDNFLVLDRQSNQWKVVGRDKIYGITSAKALRTGQDGKISIHFLADFERMRLLNVSFPFSITLTAFCKPDGEDKELSGTANIDAKHVAYARAAYFQLGDITYAERINPLNDKLTRNKRVERYSWSNVVTEYSGSSSDIYDRISMNGKPYQPPNEDAQYWLPLDDDALLRMDYTPRGPVMASYQRTSWLPPLASGIALEIEWIDGTQGQFSIHNDDNSDRAIIAVRIPNSAGRIQGLTGERVVYFAMAQTVENAGEFVARRALLATFATPAGAAAVEVGWFLYEIVDKTKDAADFLKALTGGEVDLGGGGTFIRLKSEVAQYPNPNGGMTLYTFEGSPSVYDSQRKAFTAKAGQAIDFKIGGAVSTPVFRDPPASAKANLRLLGRTTTSGLSVKYDTDRTARPAASPTAPLIASQEKTVFDSINGSGVGNQPTAPATFIIRQPHVITSIMTYHWNDGRGTRAGTIALRDVAGRLFGSWAVAGSPGQRGVPNAVWIATPNVTLPAGEYTIIDSEPSTWSQNSASGNRGMSAVKGYLPLPTHF